MASFSPFVEDLAFPKRRPLSPREPSALVHAPRAVEDRPAHSAARIRLPAHSRALPTTSIIIPTIEEAASIRELLQRIRRAVPDSEVIVVDDGSTDGTADIAESMGAIVLRRGRRMGLASAVLDGYALATGDVIGVMDGDLSHPPELIPALAAVAQTGRITVGSRYVVGGRISNWPLRRRLMSHVAAAAGRRMLGLKVRDCVSGFFFAPRAAFERTNFRAEGFKLLLNVLVDNPTLETVEVPYEFMQRVHGRSKLSAGEILNYWRTLRALKA